MELEKQVTNLELSKKLKELGVKQDSLYKYCGGHMWYQDDENGKFEECPYDGILDEDMYCPTAEMNCEYFIAAFTFSELYKIYYDRIGEVLRLENVHPEDAVNWLAEYIIFKLTVVEKWADIKGYEGLYQVSSLGNVKSIGRNTTSGVLLKPNRNRNYMAVSMCKNGRQHSFSVHRLVAETFLEVSRDRTHINHKDGNKFNNIVSNLEWATAAENKVHALKMGLLKAPKGENHWNVKLTDKQVYDIREKRKVKTLKELSEEYGVAISTIGDITTNRKRRLI